jgi:hypothetical protein
MLSIAEQERMRAIVRVMGDGGGEMKNRREDRRPESSLK